MNFKRTFSVFSLIVHRSSFIVVFPFTIFLISIILSSCKTPKVIQKENEPQTTKLKKENTFSLMSKLKSRNFNFKWLSAHFTVDMEMDSSQQSFSGIVRIRKDSIIWMNISALDGIVSILRIVLDKDSIKLLDYHDEKWLKGNYDFISDTLLGEDIDFDLIHSVMLGNSLEFFNDTAKMKDYSDGQDYILSTIPKRKIRRVMDKNKPLHTKNDAQLIWLDSKDFHIKKVRLEDFVNKRIFEATYDDFQKVDSIMFPTHIHYEIRAEKTIKIDLKYKRVNFTDNEKTPFSIPEKYEQIHY